MSRKQALMLVGLFLAGAVWMLIIRSPLRVSQAVWEVFNESPFSASSLLKCDEPGIPSPPASNKTIIMFHGEIAGIVIKDGHTTYTLRFLPESTGFELPPQDKLNDSGPLYQPPLPPSDPPGVFFDEKLHRLAFDCKAYLRGDIQPPVEPGDSLPLLDAIDHHGRAKIFKATLALSTAFQNAQVTAKRHGKELRVSSTWRSWEDQADGYCKELEQQGRVYRRAVPGLSKHWSGRAIDVYLFEDGRQLTHMTYLRKGRSQFTAADEELRRIMEENGFESDDRQPYHFVYRSDLIPGTWKDIELKN